MDKFPFLRKEDGKDILYCAYCRKYGSTGNTYGRGYMFTHRMMLNDKLKEHQSCHVHNRHMVRFYNDKKGTEYMDTATKNASRLEAEDIATKEEGMITLFKIVELMAKEDMALLKFEVLRKFFKQLFIDHGLDPDKIPNRIRTGSEVNVLVEIMAQLYQNAHLGPISCS